MMKNIIIISKNFLLILMREFKQGMNSGGVLFLEQVRDTFHVVWI